jgi:RNA-directed DNA polymerase
LIQRSVEHSYGFRPGRSAHEAVLAAQAYVQSGRRVVVDVDLEKFFDRVNHDILIDRVQKRIGDAGVIRLIRAYLNSGIMDGWRGSGACDGDSARRSAHRRCWPMCCSTKWTRNWNEGPLFVRYADDANVYVRSRRAGQAGDGSACGNSMAELRLTVNETKSAVASVFQRKFLGYSFWVAPGGVKIKRRVADKPMACSSNVSGD